MKSKLIAFVSKTLAPVVGTLGQDMAVENALRQNTRNAVPDDNVPRDPSRVALFANGGLLRPVWGFLRVEDVIR